MNRFRTYFAFFALLVVTFILVYQINYEFLNRTYKLQNIYSWVIQPNYKFNTSEYYFNKSSYNCSVITKETNPIFTFKDQIFPNIVPIYHNKSIDLKCLNSKIDKTKTILLWTKLNGLPLLPIQYGFRKPFEDLKCPITDCELTTDRSRFNQSSLVLFHLRNRIDYFPQNRPINQRWVHIIYESPINCHLCDRHENVFNLSATYTRDSDFSSIYWTDSGLYWSINETYDANADVYSRKTEFAATLISACGAPSSRTEYIKDLQNYIPINLFGKCGRPCPKNEDCREHISKNYKFFLLFENSICRDYITEKFFDTLRYDVIPVVLGGGDYSYYAPKSGYINVLDYETPKNLADYLNYLNTNKTAYNEYFKWKKYLSYTLDRPKMAFLCEMCIKLHLEEQTNQIEIKQLNSVKKLYNMYENCYGTSFQNKKLKLFKGDKLSHSYYMSPET